MAGLHKGISLGLFSGLWTIRTTYDSYLSLFETLVNYSRKINCRCVCWSKWFLQCCHFQLFLFQSTPRTGWVRCGIKKPESIADHMYRMATMAFVVNPSSNLSKDRYIFHIFISTHLAIAGKLFSLAVWHKISLATDTLNLYSSRAMRFCDCNANMCSIMLCYIRIFSAQLVGRGLFWSVQV